MAPGSIALGDVLAGHYVIESVLDEGGMAVVYGARNTGTGKSCAIKVLHSALGRSPEFVKLFAKEARVGAVIGDSPYIVQVFDAGIDETLRVPFIVMELLDGETLERALEHGPLTRDETRIVLRQLGEALDQAHAAGVVHRDLKPSNLFLTRDAHDNPVIKVMDFGIAKVLEEGAARTATQIGTPAYTAPEQMGATTRKLASKQGITIAKGISPATDVWALGLIAYELFTGQGPGTYWGIETTNELPMKVAFEDLEPATARAGESAERLPAGFDAWFARCLRKNAKERWQSAGEAIRALLKLEAGLLDDDAEPVAAAAELHGSSPEGSSVRGSSRASASEANSTAPDGSSQPPKARKSLAPPDAQKSEPGRTPKDALVPTPRSSRPLAMSEQLPTLPRTPPAPLLTVAQSPTIFEDAAKPEARSDAAPARTPSRVESADRVTRPDGPRRAEPSHRGLAIGFGAVVLAAAAAAVFLTPKGDAQSLCLSPKAGMSAAQIAGRCETACRAGSLPSCDKLAGMERRGDGVQKDDERARQMLAKACGVNPVPKPGDPSAQRWRDETKRNGCDQNGCIARACVELGGYYQDGKGGAPKQPDLAAALFQRVCQVGYEEDPHKPARGVEGCVGLGQQRERAGETPAAMAFYTAACDGGVVKGCVAKANALERTADAKTRPDNDRAAYALYQRACDASDLDGCARLGKMVERGRGGWVRDEPKAVALYKKACEGGALQGCISLAGEYAVGRGGMTRDAVKAGELYKQACEGGEQNGCALLADMIDRGEGGMTRDGSRAYSLNKAACDAGALLGCANLGEMIRHGDAGLTRDQGEARRLFQRACDGGEAVGCLRLATIETEKVDPQPPVIEALLTKACDAGAPDGCVKLGSLLEEGLSGFTKDLNRAADLYRRGCDDGSMRGCTQLANLAYSGEGGLERNPQRSAELNDKACRGGDMVGCTRLGVLYARGEGVPKNAARAQELYKDACTSASDENKSRCNMLQKLLANPSDGAAPTTSAAVKG